MKRTFLLFVIALAASCSPRVITTISQRLPPLDEQEAVTVIHEGGAFPDNGLVIGMVEVSDTGFSTKCGYDDVVELARREAEKAGGNYLFISSHILPNVWTSSCHQIVGTIVRVDESMPRARDYAEARESEPQLKPMSEGIGFQQRRFQQRRYTSKWGAPERKLSRVRFALDAMYSYRIADRLEVPSGVPTSVWRKFENGMLSGFSYGVSITGFFNDNSGLGGKFVGSHYSSKMSYLSLSGYARDKIDMFYIAPEYIARIPDRNSGNMWVFGYSLGLVVFMEEGTGIYLNRVGFRTGIEAGYDFRINEGVYFGLKAALYTGSVYLDPGNRISLNSIEVGGGFRF